MAVSIPPLDFDHQRGFEISTKYKEAIYSLERYQNYSFRSVTTLAQRQLIGFLSIRPLSERALAGPIAYHNSRERGNGLGRVG
jgi:hypothetical protein